jgi:leucyl-tRNA synthetase
MDWNQLKKWQDKWREAKIFQVAYTNRKQAGLKSIA